MMRGTLVALVPRGLVLRAISRYARWLHTRWPAGTTETLPVLGPDGTTSVPGVFVAGDLSGVPLLKFALDGGARVARRVARDVAARPAAAGELDLIVIGAGVAGMGAALEASKAGLRFEVLEAAEPFSTLVDIPRGKPIFTYPRAMRPAGDLQVSASVKEALLDELREQVARAGIRPLRARAERIERRGASVVVHLAGEAALVGRNVLVAIGRTGNFRRLGVPGEDREDVYRRLHDPSDFRGRRVLVVGGGDTALETAIALSEAGARVTLAHRGHDFWRPKRETLEALRRLEHGMGGTSRIEVRLDRRVHEIRRHAVILVGGDGRAEEIENDAVFLMIGREPPLELLRRSGVRLKGEHRLEDRMTLIAFLLACLALYDWKSGGSLAQLWAARHWFPTNLRALFSGMGGAFAAAAADRRTLLGTLAIGGSTPAFWYTLAYSAVVVVFGVRRMRRRRTPYVTAQTLCLMAVQVLPLFLLPEILLPQMDVHGWLPRGVEDALFPTVSYGHGREFWRAYGLILAWPLDVYNVFTGRPLPWWIAIAIAQTLILIPLGIRAFGKGFYCGWICSCGALAETLGDTQRHKMPHGPRWNRLNMAGQGILAVAVALLALRIVGWSLPAGNPADALFFPMLEGYKWTVDVFLAGVLGTGLYFWFSGRVWCRFFCPLAALMHVYARFSRFAIVAEKKRCISCNVCTSVCHQGIDVMSFANRGLPMIDPQCVRCSACVQECPTGVLQFGQVDRAGHAIHLDRLAASPVRMRENGPSPARA